MNNQVEKNALEEVVFPARVAQVVSPQRLVINRGSSHGIRENQRMMVYSKNGEEVIDPVTGKSLGILEIPRGTGRIIFLKEEYSIIESDQRKIRKTKTPRLHSSSVTTRLFDDYVVQEEEVILPFDQPRVGDLVKPI